MAPSSVCSAISTTVRTKFGSSSVGDANRSLPRSESAMSRIVITCASASASELD